MSFLSYRGRGAFRIENDLIRLTVLEEGGHVAEIFDKRTGISPLWTPPWPSIEPSVYDAQKHPEYGADAESKLLAGIMGHNLCLDTFGPPSPEEAAAGLTVHGEASVVKWEFELPSATHMTARAALPGAQLAVERRIRLHGEEVLFEETVENLAAFDRAVAWTQHVTLGPPFVERGATEFWIPAARSMTIEGEEFAWPHAPGAALSPYPQREAWSHYSTHLLDPRRSQLYFLAFSPRLKLLCGYCWQRADFPWIGVWDECYSRQSPPWNGDTLARGMEFGVSPFPESRRKMLERGSLWGTPAFRWIPARSRVRVEYTAFLSIQDEMPEL